MNASEIRRMKIGFEHNVLPGEVYSALALIEIAAQLAEMNQAKEKLKPDTRGPYVKSLALGEALYRVLHFLESGAGDKDAIAEDIRKTLDIGIAGR